MSRAAHDGMFLGRIPPKKPELLPEIALAELQRVGYTEDRSTQRAFAQRYLLVVIWGVTICVVAAFLLLTQRELLAKCGNDIGLNDSFVGFVFAGAMLLGGLVMAVGAYTSTGRNTAYSLRSGQPMFRFRRSDAAAGQEEIIYVDQESRTYFCRAIASGEGVASATAGGRMK